MMPTVAAHYHARVNHDDYGWSCNSLSIHLLSCSIYLDQQISYDNNDFDFDLSQFSGQQQQGPQFQPHEQPLEQQPFQAHYPYDFNNNHHYPHEQMHPMYPLSQIPMQQQQTTAAAASSSHNHSHTPLGPRYSGGNSSSNVLMLPPNQNPRGGGSLPDLRMGDMNYHHYHQVSYSTTPSPPSSATQRLFRSPSSEYNNGTDSFIWVTISLEPN